MFILVLAACGGARVTLDEPGFNAALDTDTAADSADTDTGVTDTADTATDTADSAGDTATDTADTADTGTGIDTAADTADTAVDTAVDTAETAPNIAGLSVVESGDVLVVSVTVSDADGDLEGGILAVDVDGVASTYAISSGLTSWDGSTAVVELPIEPCTHGDTWGISAAVTDAAGNASASSSTTTTLSGTSYVVAEDGDSYGDAVDLGDLSALPIYVCGDVDRAVASSYVSGQDFDWFVLEPSLTAAYTFSLTWTEPAADEDLYLVNLSGTVDEEATDHAATQPETIAVALSSGDTDYLYVVGWSLPATGYVIEIE